MLVAKARKEMKKRRTEVDTLEEQSKEIRRRRNSA